MIMEWIDSPRRGVMTGMDILARRLRQRLDHLALSQAEVVQRTGLHHETLKGLLDGTASHLPQPDRFLALCRVLGLTPAQLLGLDDRPADPRAPEVEGMLAELEGWDEARLRFAAELLDLVHEHRGAFTRG